MGCVPAGWRARRPGWSCYQLGAFDAGGRLQLVEPARLAGRPAEWWARVCYALALLVELYRALSVEGSRLQRLTATSQAEDLLGLANDDEVADLIAMQALARQHLLPHLPPGPVATGMTFDGSRDLAGDADLIAGGLLVEFKASRGGTPRKDGTRRASLARTDLYQLIGPDGLQRHLPRPSPGRVRGAVRPPQHLAAAAPGRPARRRPRPQLRTLRRQFAQVLRVELPAYWAARR
ncbi:MAG TPA: hypothetical protein VJT31_28410 [Rugosimonospora sp.]|nr:hypothetical protein [Rugosimonospora sp.]